MRKILFLLTILLMGGVSSWAEINTSKCYYLKDKNVSKYVVMPETSGSDIGADATNKTPVAFKLISEGKYAIQSATDENFIYIGVSGYYAKSSSAPIEWEISEDTDGILIKTTVGDYVGNYLGGQSDRDKFYTNKSNSHVFELEEAVGVEVPGDPAPETRVNVEGVYLKDLNGDYLGLNSSSIIEVGSEMFKWNLSYMVGLPNAYSIKGVTDAKWLNSGSKGYISPSTSSSNARNFYFYEVSNGTTGTLVEQPELGKKYIVAIDNAASGYEGLYAAYGAIASDKAERLDVILIQSGKVTTKNLPVTINLSDYTTTSSEVAIDPNKAIWKIGNPNMASVSQLQLTFSNLTASGATVNVSDGTNAVAGVKATFVGVKSDNNSNTLITSNTAGSEQILCPTYSNSKNGGYEMTFKLVGITDFQFNHVSMDVWGLNSSGGNQVSTGRNWDITLGVGNDAESLFDMGTQSGDLCPVGNQTPHNEFAYFADVVNVDGEYSIKINTKKTVDVGCFCGIKSITLSKKVEVNYTVKMGEQTLGTIQHLEISGSAPTIASAVPSYVTLSELPETITADAYTIQSSYKEGMPFEVGEKCYKISLSGTTYYVYANNVVGNVKEANSFTENPDYKWEVGGNWVTGFTFKNLSGYYIGAPSATPNNSTNTTHPTTLTSLCYFDMEQNGTMGYRFKPHGGSNYLAHTSASSLNLQFFDYYGRDKNYNAGNQLTFTEVERYSDAEVATLQSKINTVLGKGSNIGYPKADAAERYALNAYDNNYYDGVTKENYMDAFAAYNAFLNCADIVLPQAGKAYRIVVNGATDKKWYVPVSGNPTTEESGAATFVCGKNNDKFFFLLGDGSKFMRYQGADTNYDSYDARWNDFTISSLAAKTSTGFNDTYPAEKRFGYVFIESTGRDANNANKEGCLVVKEDGTWSGADDPFFNGAHTSALTFEEVDDYTANTTTFNAVAVKEDKYVGTYYSTYAVNLPEDMEAYTATAEGNILTLAKVKGNVLPKQTPVVLTYTDAETVTFTPAADSPATISNALSGTAVEISAPGNTYVLSVVDEVVGFYKFAGATLAANKAYYVSPSAVQGFVINFGDEQTTGIISATENANANGTCFDLQGRRVNAGVKGISIVNNKKVIK